MFTISTMMTTAFRCLFALTAPTTTDTKTAAVPVSSPFMVIIVDDSKSSGPVVRKTAVAKRTIDIINNDDDEQPRKRRKIECENSTISQPAEQTSMEQLTNAFGKLEISATPDAAIGELTGRLCKLSLSTKGSKDFSTVHHLARSFTGLAISKGNDTTTKKAIHNDRMDVDDSGYMMDVDDDSDAESADAMDIDDPMDVDDDDDDDYEIDPEDEMDIDSGYMMDIDEEEDDTDKMDTTH